MLEIGGERVEYDVKVLLVNSSLSLVLNFIQLRFAGDLLMELGAGVELATAAVPHLFLPLACAANVVKVCLVNTLIYSSNWKNEFRTCSLFSYRMLLR